MKKSFLGLWVVLLFGLGPAPAQGGEVSILPARSEPSVEFLYSYSSSAENDAIANATNGSRAPGHIGDMSDEEKERRREVCDREKEYCDDWCGKTKSGRACYNECMKKYTECLKAIPNRPIPDPDY